MLALVRWSDAAADGSFLEAWQALEDRAVEPNPFFSPAVVLAAARHLEGGDRMSLLVERDPDGELRFLLPVVSALPGDPLALRTRLDRAGVGVTGLRTWLHPYCFQGTPLLDAAVDPVALWHRVLTGLRRTGGRPWCELPMLPRDGLVARALATATAGAPGVVREDLGERHVVHRRPEATYLQDWLSKKNRSNLARRRRQLVAEVGSLTCSDRMDDAAGVLDEFLELEGRGWKGQRRSAMIARPQHAAFFREALGALAADKRVVLLSLDGPEGALAQSIVLRGGGAEFGFKRAYDPRWSRYSPGSLLDLEMLERFHRGGADHLDTCSYPGVPTHDVFGDRQAMVTVAVPTSRPGQVLLPRLWAAQCSARARLRDGRLGSRLQAWRRSRGVESAQVPAPPAPVTGTPSGPA